MLVTGGAGYIGSVVAEWLLGHGHGVVVYDNLVRGHADAVPPGGVLVRGDLLDGATLARELREHRIEAVVHMAAESLVGEFNARVKSKQKYWNRPEGAEAILQLRAAVLSEDERLERHFAQRPGNFYRRRQTA